ncbi:MAG TPA: endo-1,4-beta-xylanase, partial [Mucilaginibacter sp.]
MKSFSVIKKNKNGGMLSAAVFVTFLTMQCTPRHNFRSTSKVAAKMADSNMGLKDYYRNYFPIGVAVNTAALHGPDSALIVREFNSVTPENDMKMGPIHPSENVYNWKNADAIVDFAVNHHIKIRGHNLCWHNQEAAWMFTGPDGKQVSKELLLQRLKDHIFTVVKRYKGKIYA